ncbi:MAG: hypothetical protein Salg2KO_04250 [Salibacteraceae bacterium]
MKDNNQLFILKNTIENIQCESYWNTEKSELKVRPLPGQGLSVDLNIECSEKIRFAYPEGTSFATENVRCCVKSNGTFYLRAKGQMIYPFIKNIELLEAELCNSKWQHKDHVCRRLHKSSFERALIEGYTDWFSKDLNFYLGKEKVSSPDRSLALELASVLDAFLLKNCQHYAGKTVFHDPKRHDAHLWCQNNIGEVLEFPYFFSTSAEEKKNGGGYPKFIIETSPKCRGFEVRKWSAHPSELEILFPRGSKFKILKIEIHGDREYVHMIETDEKSDLIVNFNTQYYKSHQ